MLRKIILSLIFVSLAQACYLCSIIDPSVFANTRIISDEQNIHYIQVRWSFSKLYAYTAAQKYDKNIDAQIDEQEARQVFFDFYKLLEQNDYNTLLRINNKKITIKDKIFDKNVHLSHHQLYSSFSIKLNYPLKDIKSISIDYIDKNEILTFYVKDKFLSYNFPSNLNIKSNKKEAVLPIEIYVSDPKADQTKRQETPDNGLFVQLAQILAQTSHKIHVLLVDIKGGNRSSAFFYLLLFAFIYGFIHASGPGHGKSLVASYMLSHDKDIKKALSMSILIAFVHVFSAFLMTFGIYAILNEFFTAYIKNTEIVATKLSGLIILIIAIYMIKQRLRVQKQNKKFTFKLHPHSCGCSACNSTTNTTDLGVIISAGIIPCPGTVAIFITTLSLGTYFVGFLAAISMSFGMSLVIFLTASGSIYFRKNLKKTKLIRIFDNLALLFIFVLALLLLLM